jgi:uncharacterized protein
VSEGSRIASLDVARGLALFGILLMNITGFGLPFAYSNPTIAGGAEGADLWAWIITEIGFEGTQRGLFTLLFGAGVVLLTTSLEKSARPNAQDIFFRRNLWLVVFGVVHAFVLLWWGEILFYYGVTALFVYGLRNAQTRTLLTLAIGGLVLAAGWTSIENRDPLKKHREFVTADSVRTSGDSLTADQTKAIEAWEAYLKNAKPDSARMATEITTKQGGYWGIMKLQAPRVTRYQSWWTYRSFFDNFSMMLLGIVLFRAGVITAERSKGLYTGMVLAGYGVGLTVNSFETFSIINSGFSPLAFAQVGVTYDLGRLAMTLGHLGAIMLFCKSGWFGWLRRSLSAVGRMAFTNYITHSIICAFVFYGFGFGMFNELSRHELYYVVFGIWIFQLIVSPIWLNNYRFGPLEWLWRWLSYGEKPRMKGAAGGEG